MTFHKRTVAALAAVAALTAGLAVADTASARGRGGGHSRGHTTFSLSIGGPGYGAYYGNRYARPYRYGYARPYYGRPYYPGYYGARYRGCDRWVWDGWRRTYVLVRGRC